jgi:hypothetical protein
MTRVSFLRVFIIIVAICAAGCSSTGGPGGAKHGIAGGGYEEKAAGYPEGLYLRAVGLGQSEPEARNRALSELSRIFVSQVRSEAVDTVKSVMVDRRGESFEETLYSRIRVFSELELEGVEIPEVWKDGATYYALAVLDRQKAARGWKLKIEDIDSQMEGELLVAGSRGSKLLRYRSFRKVAALWAERAVYMSRLNVLGFSAPSMQEEQVRGAVRDLAALKSSMRLFLDISGSSKLAGGVAESLGRAGHILAPARGGADVVISGSVEVRELDMNADDWKYARATASLSVVDAVTGESVGEVSENIRSAHVSYSEASEKSLRSLTPKVSDAIIAILDN